MGSGQGREALPRSFRGGPHGRHLETDHRQTDALAGGITQNSFLNALNRAVERGELSWHRYGCRWEATVESPENRDLQRIIVPLLY